jgi:hypothetical protein
MGWRGVQAARSAMVQAARKRRLRKYIGLANGLVG